MVLNALVASFLPQSDCVGMKRLIFNNLPSHHFHDITTTNGMLHCNEMWTYL